jgi:hypothetical protein
MGIYESTENFSDPYTFIINQHIYFYLSAKKGGSGNGIAFSFILYLPVLILALKIFV